MLNKLSFKYKVPILITVLILATVCVLTAAIATRTYQNNRETLFASARQLGETLATTIEPAIRTDSMWEAYMTLTAPLAPIDSRALTPDIVVIDLQRRVFVSTNPVLFPTLAEIDVLPTPFAEQLSALIQDSSNHTLARETENTNRLYLSSPIVSNGVLRGHVVMVYSRDVLLPSVYAIVQDVLAWTLVILLVSLPIGWYVGRQIVSPLSHLASCMEKLPDTPPGEIDFNPGRSSDEIGMLGTRFKLMLEELDQKKKIEQQVITGDRLAAIGRMTSGIAHEINNPLGGMLNAINTLKHHPSDPRLAERTFSLIERGLLQVKETVSALLVEARLETHPFSRDDIEDVKTLVEPGIHEKSGILKWHSSISQDLPLPSTQVRQILINLLHNAIEGINDRGRVACELGLANGSLEIRIVNDGCEIPRDKMDHLFEPFYTESENGVGLGLWVTYQIIQQLNGEISVENQPDRVCFNVSLPVPI